MIKLQLTPEQVSDLANIPAFLVLKYENGGQVETGVAHPAILEELAFQNGGFFRMTMVQTGEAMLFYRDYDPVKRRFGDYYA